MFTLASLYNGPTPRVRDPAGTRQRPGPWCRPDSAGAGSCLLVGERRRAPSPEGSPWRWQGVGKVGSGGWLGE